MKAKVYVIGLIAVLSIASAATAVPPSPITLVDLSSSAVFDPTTVSGQSSWMIDQINYLNKQWFWYRVGSGGPEYSIDALSMPSPPIVSHANFNPGNDTLAVRYTDAVNNFMIDLVFHLAGTPPGAGRADLAESIKITNTGDAALDFHFFQYVDLNLSPNDTVSFMNPNTVRQTAGVLVASETVITPAPNHREVALAGITLAKLTDGAPTTLSGNAGPVSGDVTWAFQWDFVIPAKKAVLISKDKQLIVPEPATVLLAALGSLVLSRRRRTV